MEIKNKKKKILPRFFFALQLRPLKQLELIFFSSFFFFFFLAVSVTCNVILQLLKHPKHKQGLHNLKVCSIKCITRPKCSQSKFSSTKVQKKPQQNQLLGEDKIEQNVRERIHFFVLNNNISELSSGMIVKTSYSRTMIVKISRTCCFFCFLTLY